MNQLKQQIKEFTEAAGGTWGIVVEDMDKGATFSINEKEIFNAASIIKVPIMAAIFTLVEDRKINLGDLITLEKEDIVGGSGVLQHMSPGIEISIYDLLILMTIQSDNTATNKIIDIVGTNRIQQTMKDLEMNNSSFCNKLQTRPVKTAGTNTIAAKDVNRLLKMILMGHYVSAYACRHMIFILKKQQLSNGLTTYLPPISTPFIGVRPEWEVASKTGSVTGILHEAGIFYVGNRTVLVTVFSKNCSRLEAKNTIGNIGEAVYHYMSED